MKFSLRFKTLALIIVFAIIIGVVTMVVSARVIANMTEREYKSHAEQIVWTVAKSIDASEFDRLKEKILEIYDYSKTKVGSWDWGSDAFYEYLGQYDSIYENEDYKALLSYLQDVTKANDVESLYLMLLDKQNKYAIYVVDSADVDPCPPGCIDEIYDFNNYILENPMDGMHPYITNTDEYGWLVTAGAPVFLDSGEFVGLVLADISMQEERNNESHYLSRLLIFLLASIILIVLISSVFIEFSLIRPLYKITKAAKDYCNENITKEHNNFASIRIRTHDEIEELANSMKHMENDINEQMANLISTNNELVRSRRVVNEMTQLANKDALTGLKNKTAYNKQVKLLEDDILNGKRKFGIVMIDLNDLKKINDTYGHEHGDEAILLLSQTICSVFVHSPVFRLGGDEFVVVIKNNDYEKVEELVKEFRNKTLELKIDETSGEWLRISAAIGYAKYEDDIDKGVNDVYNRADDKMYKNKRTMKGL